MRWFPSILAIALASACFAQVVCIDPGHPSENGPGTEGKKLTEMHAAWIEANLLKRRLEKLGIKVVMTKSKEGQKVKNRRRAEIANAAHAALIVRLHCDGASGTGFASYYPTQTGKIQGVTGPSNEVLKSSAIMARRFHAGLAESLQGKLRDNGLKSDLATFYGAKQGAMTGSIFSKVPIVLVEMVVLTNRKDEAFLASKAGQAAMADALTAGVLAALEK
jgi:N-acetylmuramoyl-L-alanine amidase